MTTIAILGLGEAGRLYAGGLAEEGADVRGYDPHHVVDDPAVRQVPTLEEALAGVDVVLSLVGAAAAASVARDALTLAPRTAVYADFNTASPELKQEIAEIAAEHGVAMADVAVLAPVYRARHRTELLASGPGASDLAERLGPLGAAITVVTGEAGEAARLRLLRSVFMKGLAALVIEGLGAARAVGAEEWLHGQISREFGADGAAFVDRLVEGTHHHVVRREHEMRDALAALEATGAPADMTRATLVWFQRILAERQG